MPGAFFGARVSIEGDTLIVGAPGENSDQNTITNGSSANYNTSAVNSGAVYVFRRYENDGDWRATAWKQIAYIKASNAESKDYFSGDAGWENSESGIDISGNTIVVGAMSEKSNQNTITQGEASSTNNSLINAGAVYVYKN